MTDRLRIIFIYHRSYGDWFPERGQDAWYLAGHTGMIASHLGRFSPQFEIENWRPDITARTYTQRVVCGVRCRVFPATTLPAFGEVSVGLLRELSNVASSSQRIIIHYGGLSAGLFYYALARYSSRIRILGNHQGDRLRQTRADLKALPRKHLERRLFRRAHHYLCAGQTTIKQLLSLGIRPESLSFPEIGIDLELFRPMDQGQARRALDLPLDKPLILYVGRAGYHKGLPQLLAAIPEITSQTGAQLICVGCSQEDPLYACLRELNVLRWPVVEHHVLPLFHNACDVFVRAAVSQYGPVSVGVNVAEALACGTPVVSPTLAELPYYERYGGALGVVPETDVAGSVVRVIKDGKAGRAEPCREAVDPYDWQQWLRNLTSIYEC